MLELLHIENIAVIQEADIQFRPGFNALTGETGAGKSIVIDAMGAVLGGRTSRDLVRTGADRAFVSAEFSQVPGDLAGLAETGSCPGRGRPPAAPAGADGGRQEPLPGQRPPCHRGPAAAGSEKSC